jgi:hypothetical protein
MGNIEAVMAHQTGLRRIVRLLGGVDALPHMTLSKLYQYVQLHGLIRIVINRFPQM